MSAVDQLIHPIPSAPETTVVPSYFTSGPLWYLERLSRWRNDLGLPHPGTVENLQKEAKSTHLTNYSFDGARADLTKSLSMSPLFQVTHSFAFGSPTIPSSYNFGAVFASTNVFLQGSVDHEGNVNARFNNGWTPGNVTKVQAQFSQQPEQNMIQLEHDYQGQDFSVNLKGVNPSPSDLTGIYVGSYLQSISKNFALGFETLYQRQTPSSSEFTTSYLARLIGNEKNWIATAQVQPSVLQATYWQKLSEKVEVAAELQVLSTPTRRDAIATLGAKYEFRLANFRAQVDSTGKVSALLEQRFTPAFAFLVAGEIDHFKNAAKVGVGVMIESSTLTPEEMGMVPPPQ